MLEGEWWMACEVILSSLVSNFLLFIQLFFYLCSLCVGNGPLSPVIAETQI